MVKIGVPGKRLTLSVLVLLALFAFSCGTAFAAENKVVLSKYPDLKLGFTTAQFLKFLPPTLANEKTLIDFASEQGFAFIEIRDPAAKLSYKDCRAIAAYAAKKNIEVIYAVNVGVLDANYAEVFARAVANASVFKGPRLIRSGANGVEFDKADKKYWTADEFAKLVQGANQAGNTAKMFGLTFLFENAREGLKGDGVTTFGWSDLLGAVNANVGWQLDTGNFFCVSRVPADPREVGVYFAKNVAKVGYMHLKTSVNHVSQPVIGDNELGFDAFFGPCADNGMLYIAIELDAGTVKSLEALYDCHVKSLQYLTQKY